ncbi:MAG TPA: DUF4293 domain-containing protein [Candidatus Phocaeicola gallistercoris]|nr:DUF4293 domain-containing protein [Candidatus Phocaeicola gallistercoris]
MIQRIQTIYLLIIVVLMVMIMSLPMGYFYTETSIIQLSSLSLRSGEDVISNSPWPMFVISIIVAIITFITIFSYKIRQLQIRLTSYSILFLIGYYIVFALLVWKMTTTYSYKFSCSWAICLPLISIILGWMAIRAIKKDEMLVKSYDRIR